jgi:hypothetical protein
MVPYILVGMFAAFETEKLRSAILSGAGALVGGKASAIRPNTLDSTAVWRLSIDVIRPLRSSLGFERNCFSASRLGFAVARLQGFNYKPGTASASSSGSALLRREDTPLLRLATEAVGGDHKSANQCKYTAKPKGPVPCTQCILR